MKAQDTIHYMHVNSASGYKAKHFFTRIVGSYIQYVENNEFELKWSRSLPISIQASPFEALFCQIYLDGHFDWNKLSAKEVVALWLENVCLSEDAQKLLTEDMGTKLYNGR